MYIVWILALVLLIELILLASASRPYYRFGITILRLRRVSSDRQKSLDWTPRLVRRSETDFAILAPRSELLIFMPLMRGVLRAASGVEVIGRVSWSAAAFSIYMVVAATAGELWLIAVFVLLLDTIIYVFQAHRFRQVLANAEMLIAEAA